MADKLTELYNSWEASVVNPNLFQAFQGGFSGSASSMRTRALTIIQGEPMSDTLKNKLLTAIGQLSDIPK